MEYTFLDLNTSSFLGFLAYFLFVAIVVYATIKVGNNHKNP